MLVTVDNTSEFAIGYGLANGVSSNAPRRGEVVGSFLRTKIVDDASPIVYGVTDNLAVYSDNGESFNVSNSRGGGRGRRWRRGGGGGGARARPAAARRTTPTSGAGSRARPAVRGAAPDGAAVAGGSGNR